MHSLLLLGLASLATALPLTDSSVAKRSSASLKSRAAQLTSNVVSLQRAPGSGKTSTSHLHSYLYGEEDLLNIFFSTEFIANITFGNQTFLAIIDTGSSDTWLVESDFTCVNQTNNATVPQETCAFGPLYTPDGSLTQILDENFNISYADGEYLNGIVGYDSITFANITVPKQEVALATLAAWDGDGISSGLIGLAFPALTSAYLGTNASADITAGPNATDPESNSAPYSSLINTIFFVDNLTAPVFALALSRDASQDPTTATGYGGVISIGGVPDVTDPTINATGYYVSTPIEILTAQFINPATPEYQFYTITVYGFAAETTKIKHDIVFDNMPTQYIVDSGTTLLYIPTDDAVAANALFDPPAVLSEDYGVYVVECNATAPEVAFFIADLFFLINPYDLVQNEELGDGLCISGIQDGGSGPYILGDVFLNNVLAVFDVGNLEMHFSPRVYYES